MADEPPRIGRLLDHHEQGHFFHAAHSPGVTSFTPRLRTMNGFFNGRPIKKAPMVFLTNSPIHAAILAWGRAAPTWGFSWCIHPLPDNTFAITYMLEQPRIMKQRLRDSLVNGPQTGCVYVFDRNPAITNDYPLPNEWISLSALEPIDCVQLESSDCRWLERNFVPLSERDANLPQILLVNGHGPFADRGACTTGGHLQVHESGTAVAPRIALTDDIVRQSQQLRAERVRMFPPDVKGSWGYYFEPYLHVGDWPDPGKEAFAEAAPRFIRAALNTLTTSERAFVEQPDIDLTDTLSTVLNANPQLRRQFAKWLLACEDRALTPLLTPKFAPDLVQILEPLAMSSPLER